MRESGERSLEEERQGERADWLRKRRDWRRLLISKPCAAPVFIRVA